MADSLMTWVDEVNLKSASLLSREVLGLEAGRAGGGGGRPTASNRPIPEMSTFEWVLAASEILRRILDFLSIASCGDLAWQTCS